MSMEHPHLPTASAPPPRVADADRTGRCADAPVHTVASAELLAGAREVVIEHRGESYRLRHTRNDKLILTK